MTQRAIAVLLMSVTFSQAEIMVHLRYMNPDVSNCVSAETLPVDLASACQVWVPFEIDNSPYIPTCGTLGNTRVATFTNPATMPVVSNGVAFFDGVNDLINIGAQSSSETPPAIPCMTGAAPRTVTMWVNITNANLADTRGMMYWGWPQTALQGIRIEFALVYPSNVFFGWDSVGNHSKTTNRTLNPGAWHHIALVYGGGSFHTNSFAYIDGTNSPLVHQGSGALNTQDYPTTRCIGNNRATANRYFPGYMDDIGIFNRVLTAQEITNLYQRGHGTHTFQRLSPETGTVDVAVFVGNSQERGYISAAPDTNCFEHYAQPIPYPQFWAKVGNSDGTYYYAYQDWLQRPYAPSFSFAYPSCLVFGHRWADYYGLTGDARTDPTLKTAILLSAEDGRSITNWSRHDTYKWSELTNQVMWATTNWTLRGWTPRWRYLTFAIGESDAYGAITATGHADNLVCLSTSFWSLVHQTGRVYLVALSTNLSTYAEMTNYATVRDQQTVQWTNKMYGLGLTNCAVTTASDNWLKMADQVHYSGTGLVDMGVDRWNDYRANVLGD